MKDATQLRSGRRPGETTTRAQILEAARAAFGRESYEGATIRSIASAAGVDPALVIHFFKSKAGLFEAAMELPFVPAEVFPALIRGEAEEMGERFVRFYLQTWDVQPARERMLGLIRSAVSEEAAATTLRGYLVEEVFAPLASLLRLPSPELRAALVASQLIGLAFARYVLRVDQLVAASSEDLVALVGPAIQRYLSPDLPGAAGVKP
ncbi:MAG: TetR family transcriptional regulator [Anaerolinea sp.]|nr:TetR family transcriptional regulator [Anaerolinea sp.]